MELTVPLQLPIGHNCISSTALSLLGEQQNVASIDMQMKIKKGAGQISTTLGGIHL